MAGFYNDESTFAASTCSGASTGRSLFDDYLQNIFSIEDDRVPGLAFKNASPFVELNESELQRLVSSEAQMQFYQEAKIKTAILMGCKAGEIELGFDHPQVNLEAEMKNWFPEDFFPQASQRDLPPPLDPGPNSSSSSSLHSLSLDSSDCSTYLFSMPNTPLTLDLPTESQTIFDQNLLRPTSTTPISPLYQAMQPFSTQMRSSPQLIPTLSESENDAMTKAILAVLSSTSTPSLNSSSSSMTQGASFSYLLSQKDRNVSAFKKYGTGSILGPRRGINVKQNMIKKSIGFLRALNTMRRQDRVQGNRPNTTQLHHMISERKRREKLNESFEVLRSLLPSGTKKDKATVLRTTTECLTSLKTQTAELTKQVQDLETKISRRKELRAHGLSIPSDERVDVHVENLAQSTSQTRLLDLQVSVRGEVNNLDLVIRLLEFLKQVENVEVVTMEADTRVVESDTVNNVILRLKIEGEWDNSAFQEAVRRVLADLGQ